MSKEALPRNTVKRWARHKTGKTQSSSTQFDDQQSEQIEKKSSDASDSIHRCLRGGGGSHVLSSVHFELFCLPKIGRRARQKICCSWYTRSCVQKTLRVAELRGRGTDLVPRDGHVTQMSIYTRQEQHNSKHELFSWYFSCGSRVQSRKFCIFSFCLFLLNFFQDQSLPPSFCLFLLNFFKIRVCPTDHQLQCRIR